MPLQAILFDYGLVLSGPPDPAAWARFHHILRAHDPEFHAAYWRHRELYDRGVLTGETYWNAVAFDLKRVLDPVHLDELLEADTDLWTQPNQPMIDFAAALQRHGYKTGILSNLGDAMEAGITARFPWLEGFTHKTFSHRLNLAKPDPAIYQHAAEGLAEPPANILFLDDREDNIQAARAAGMMSIQYLNHDQFRHELALTHAELLPFLN